MTKYYEEGENISFVFSRSSGTVIAIVISVIFLAVGLPFLAASIISILEEIPKEQFSLFNISQQSSIFLLFGIMFSLIPIILLINAFNRKQKLYIPESFTFDKKNKEFIIKEFSGEIFKIPFSFITKLDIRYYIVRGKRTSTTYYVLYILKKDGAFIDLFVSTSNEKVKQLLSSLQSKLGFENVLEVKYEDLTKLPEKIVCDESEQKTVFRWENKVNILGFIVVFFMIFIFFYLFIQISKAEIVPLIFISIMAFIICITVVFGIIKAVRYAFNFVSIYIDREKLSFGFLSKKGFNFKAKKEIPLKDLKKVQYCFDFQTEVNSFEKNLIVVNEETKSILERKLEKNENIPAAVEAVKGKMKNLNIPVTGLSLVDLLKFEKVLEDHINKFGGKVI